MLHLDAWTPRNPSGLGAMSASWSPNELIRDPPAVEVGLDAALVHVVDVDDSVRRLLARWLAAGGIESRTYAHLGAFLEAQRADRPGCLVIDAQPPAIRGLESEAILLPLAIRCPIVLTACRPGLSVAVANAARTGTIEFVEKPLREREILTAIRSAIELDRRRHRIASLHTELRARLATLSRREQQVMVLVATGKLNKQIACDLGLSEITIKAHRGAVMRKMRAGSLADLVRMADALDAPTS